MKDVIKNIKPIRMIVAFVLFILLFLTSSEGNFLPVYMFAVLINLIFFSIFQSYFLIAPILTILVALVTCFQEIVENRNYQQSLLMIVSLLVIGVVIAVIKYFVQLRQLGKYSEIVNGFSNDKLHFNEEKLRASHLSTDELSFFKTEMRKYYKDYQYLESVKIIMEHELESYDKDLAVIHAIFNELIDSPRMLLKMNDFLYSHLKDYVDKVKAIVDLDDNVVESDEDKQLVENAKEQLATISHQFRDDFIQVTEDERDALKE